MIEILASGPANCIHDRGRRGLLHLGVSRSGAMDLLSFDIANALLGNDPQAAAIEVAMFPFRLRFETDTSIALTGADAGARLDGQKLPPFWVLPVKAGAELLLSPPRRGMRAYLGFAGGIAVPPVLGSRSTDLKSCFGGFLGRGLAKGDRLPLGDAAPRKLPQHGLGATLDAATKDFWAGEAGAEPLRIIAAAEYKLFTPQALADFSRADWLVTNEANRMGYRLSGPELALTRKLELFSHGIVPGTIQVPASGQPIIQLADANTCGGYPKLAVVIEPDLWKLAQLGPGDRIRFVEANLAEALAAFSAQRDMVTRIRAGG